MKGLMLVKKIKGKVIEIYIPRQNMNSGVSDLLNEIKICYRISSEAGIIEVAENYSELLEDIEKGDDVVVTKKILSGKYCIDIEPLGKEEI